MKKLSIICSLLMVFGLMSAPAFAANYAVDYLEATNSGGWTGSAKSFDDATGISVGVGDTFDVDVWLRGCPATPAATSGGFWIDFTGSTALLNITSIQRYDGELPGPWATGGGVTNIGPLGSIPDGAAMVVVVNPGGASPDGLGDLIIAKVTFTCLAEGIADVQVSPIPGYGTWGPKPEWDDAAIPALDFDITCGEVSSGCEGNEDCDDDNVCTDDICNPDDPGADDNGCVYINNTNSCDDGLFCTEIDVCDEGECVGSGDPCPDDGVFCNGTESCNESSNQCVSSGNPCPIGFECSEDGGGTCIEKQCVTLTIGDADGAPGEIGVPVEVGLTNLNDKVRAVQMDVCEEIDGSQVDYLDCTGCEISDTRSAFFRCETYERADGCCRVVLVSDGGLLITEDTGTILTISYDVKESAPGGCEDLTLVNAKVADEAEDPLPLCELEPGEFCFMICGDIAPLTGSGPNDCGNFEVDISDVLDAIDIALGIIAAPTDCQWTKGNVPTGLPESEGGTGCRPADDEIDIFDVLVIIDKVLENNNCCW